MKIYTSCYKTIARQVKQDNDFYVSVSRTLPLIYHKSITGEAVRDLIDVPMGDMFGMYSNLDDYTKDLQEGDLDYFYSEFLAGLQKIEDENNVEIRLFLLCFEDIFNDVYTKKDKEKYPNDPHCIVGAKKLCHRTLLAKVLNEKYHLNITEYIPNREVTK